MIVKSSRTSVWSSNSHGHVLVSCLSFYQHNKYCRESGVVAKFAILEMLNTKLQFGFSFRMEYMINSGLVRIGAIHKWIPNLNWLVKNDPLSIVIQNNAASRILFSDWVQLKLANKKKMEEDEQYKHSRQLQVVCADYGWGPVLTQSIKCLSKF